MRKPIILLTAVALSATTLSFADAAFARSGDREAREPQTRSEVETRANEAFTRLDANSDGVLSKADREAGVAEFFAKADADGNGQLSLAEVTAARDARREDRRERMSEGPRGDGPRGRGSRGNHREGMAALHRLGGIVRSADADGDEQITQAEFSSAALARFDQADSDGDGAISREERKGAMRESFRPRRGRHGA